METAETIERPETRELAFALVPAEKVGAFAPLVHDFLSRACDYSGGRFAPETVLPACAGQDAWEAQLWIAGYFGGDQPPTLDACAVTAIRDYPTGLRVLDVILVGGKNKAWLKFEPEFLAWAKKQGCSKVQQVGRRGWSRTLSEKWKQSATVFEYDLEAQDGG